MKNEVNESDTDLDKVDVSYTHSRYTFPHMDSVYDTIINIPTAEVLKAAVNSYFGSDNYALEKIGIPIVEKLAGRIMTLSLLITSLLAIQDSKSAELVFQLGDLAPIVKEPTSPYSLLSLFCDRETITKLWKGEQLLLDGGAVEQIPTMVTTILDDNTDHLVSFKLERKLRQFGPYVAEELEKRWRDHPTDEKLSNYCSELANLSMGYISYGNFVTGILAVFASHHDTLNIHATWRMMDVLSKYRDIQQLDPQQQGITYAMKECKLASPLTWGSDKRNERGDNALAALDVIGNYDIKDDVKLKQELMDLIPDDKGQDGYGHYGNGYARKIATIVANSCCHMIPKDGERHAINYPHPSFQIMVQWYDHSQKWSVQMVSERSRCILP